MSGINKSVFSLVIATLSFNALSASDYGPFKKEQICAAGIATNNGRSLNGIIAQANKENGDVTVSYRRDDGKHFEYQCRIQDNQLLWRDSTMVRWSKNIKLFWSIENNNKDLTIRSEAFGDSFSKRYSARDF